MDAIIPAAGMASRMRGIPKFLLPCDEVYTTLIEIHIQALLENCQTIWIPTRPENVLLLDSIGLAKDRVILLPMSTDNMTQTVLKVLQIAQAERFQLVMPDTYFLGGNPYAALSESNNIVDLACWKIRKDQRGKLGQVLIQDGFAVDMQDKDPTCEYEHSWGALSFSRDLMKFAKTNEPHIGYAVKSALEQGEMISAFEIEGKYFDCGTPAEYLGMLQEVLRA